MTRKICYISGTRADYGLMRATLNAIARTSGVDLSIIVTGMHLSEQYGLTVGEIERDGFDITARVATDMTESTGASTALGIAAMISGFTEALQRNRPDLVVLLGDRGEMLAGAIAAIHLNIPIAHIHGGERSGTVDEPVRHAISKLSHIHLTATEGARDRLVKMGEAEDHIHVVGAPGLVGLEANNGNSRTALAKAMGFAPERPIALMVHHPVLQEADGAGDEVRMLLEQLAIRNLQTVALMPNADAGSDLIRHALEQYAQESWLHIVTHLHRDEFISWMAIVDFMIGNSSSGIIEAASFGTPVINVGSRQHLRERNANIVDVEARGDGVGRAIDEALSIGRFPCVNIYGDGKAADRIAALLKGYRLGGEIIRKSNAY